MQIKEQIMLIITHISGLHCGFEMGFMKQFLREVQQGLVNISEFTDMFTRLIGNYIQILY